MKLSWPQATAAVVVVTLCSGLGARMAPHTRTAIVVTLITLPWFVGRKRHTFSPLLVVSTGLFLTALYFAGGNRPLAVYLYLGVAPAAILAGQHVRNAPNWLRLSVSAAMGLIEWPLIVAQANNPSLVADRVDAAQVVQSAGLGSSAYAGLRPVGNTVSPGLVVVILLAGLALVLTMDGLTRRANILRMGLLAAHAGAIFLTGSRTGLASLAIICILVWRNRKWLRVVLSAGAIYLAYDLANNAQRVTISTRLDIVRAALPALRTHMPDGVGWANTPKYVYTPVDGIIYHLHILPLHILFELGVAGLLALACVLLQLYRTSRVALLVISPFVLLDAGTFIDTRSLFFMLVLFACCAVDERKRTATPSRRAAAALV